MSHQILWLFFCAIFANFTFFIAIRVVCYLVWNVIMHCNWSNTDFILWWQNKCLDIDEPPSSCLIFDKISYKFQEVNLQIPRNKINNIFDVLQRLLGKLLTDTFGSSKSFRNFSIDNKLPNFRYFLIGSILIIGIEHPWLAAPGCPPTRPHKGRLNTPTFDKLLQNTNLGPIAQYHRENSFNLGGSNNFDIIARNSSIPIRWLHFNRYTFLYKATIYLSKAPSHNFDVIKLYPTLSKRLTFPFWSVYSHIGGKSCSLKIKVSGMFSYSVFLCYLSHGLNANNL